MRLPSENFFRRFLTFHSTSAGGFLEPPPKYMSYSIFSRRSWSSSKLSSSSIAKGTAPFQNLKVRLAPGGSIQAEYTIERPPLLRAQGTVRAPALRYFAGSNLPQQGPEYRPTAILSCRLSQPEREAFHHPSEL